MRAHALLLACLPALAFAGGSATPGKPDFTGFYSGAGAAPFPAPGQPMPAMPAMPPGGPGGPGGAPGGAPVGPGGTIDASRPFFPEDQTTRYNCIPDTAFGYNPYGDQLVMTPGRLTWINQYNHVIRRIDIDQPPVRNPKASYTGTSAGHWEGETLVVETTGFRKAQVAGVPVDGQVDRITERITALDGGARLERLMHIVGHGADGKPVEVDSKSTYTRQAGQHLAEFICEDGAEYFGEAEGQ